MPGFLRRARQRACVCLSRDLYAPVTTPVRAATGPVGAPTSGRLGCGSSPRGIRGICRARFARQSRRGRRSYTAEQGLREVEAAQRSRNRAEQERRGATGTARRRRTHRREQYREGGSREQFGAGAPRDEIGAGALILRPAPCCPCVPTPARPHSRGCWRWIRWAGRGSCWLPGSRS